MAEDREDGSPGEEAEQFEVLDEVGEVEGWDGEFPDDDDEQDMDDEDEQVGETEERAVADSVPQSNKTQETVATENEHVCVKPSSVEKNNSSAADKEEKEQSQMSLNRESSRKDVKSEPAVSKEVQSNEATASKDVILIDLCASEDGMVKEASARRHAPSKEASASIDALSKDASASTDAPSKEASASRVAPSEEVSASIDAPSNESCASRDAPSNESMGSAFKRKSDNEVQKPEEAKKMKLLCGKEDNSLPSVEEIEVISTDPRKAHHIRKELFMNTMHKLSEELKRGKEYRSWVQKMRKDGMMFPVFDIDVPAKPILFNNCQLVSGYENDSTTLCLGFARIDKVLRYSALEAIYVPEVRSTIKAFEEMVQSCSKPLFDPCTLQGYWHGVNVTTNSKGEILLKVDLFAANEQEGEVRFAEAKDILVKFFSSERPELNCHISGMYLRLVFTKTSSTVKVASERTASRCIMGSEFIVETIGDIKIRLYPWSFFSTGTAAMTSLCEKMLKVLFQEGCETVVELGCGTGIVGHFLAKHCANVLGVDLAECIAEAKVNADENHLSNCTYFDGKEKDVWKTLGDALRSKSSAMVIVNALNYDYLAMGPVISCLTRSNKVFRVVYIKMLTSKSRVTILCIPPRKRPMKHNIHKSYFPLYALPVNLGTKCFATVLVLQHVKHNFTNELFKTREKYTVKCIRIAFSKTSGLHIVEDVPQEESTSAPRNITVVMNVGRNRNLAGVRGPPTRRDVDTDGTRASGLVQLGGSERLLQPRGDHSNPTDADHSAVSRNMWVNKDGTLTTHIDAIRHDGTLPPQEFRNVLQSQPVHNHIGGFLDKLVSPTEIQDLTTVLQEKRMYAERHVDVADDFRKERLTDEIIHDRNRNLLVSSFVHGIVPPETEDLRQVLQEKKVMVENISGDRNETSRQFYGRGQVRVYENNDLPSFIEENRVTHMNEGKDSLRESSMLPHNKETWDGARMGMSFRDELSSGNNLYPPDVWGKLHSRNSEPEAFPLVKDSTLFEHGLDSKINVRDERRKVMFADVQDMRSIGAELRGSGAGRSFDDAELGRRKPRTDDVSGIKTDVRGINIRAGCWNARDDIHDSFSALDTYLSNVRSSIKDLKHSWETKPEFNRPFPNASMKSDWRALSSNLKLQVTGDVRRENPYSDDKPNYFGEGDKSIKAEWFSLNEKRPEVGIAERNRVTFKPIDNQIMFSGTDRIITQRDRNERNRVVGASVSERRIFGGSERPGAIVDGPDDRNKDRKLQVFKTEDRIKQVFSEPNRNSLMYGGSEDRKRSLYDVEYRNRSVYGELEDRKRQMYDEPDAKKRQMYGELDYRKRQTFGEPDDRKGQVYVETDISQNTNKLMYGKSGDQKRLVYVEPEDLKRLPYDEPGDLRKTAYVEPGDRERSTYEEPEDRKGSLHGEPVDSKRKMYSEQVDTKRQVYDETIDRQRHMFGEPGDGKKQMFEEPDDRKRQVFVETDVRQRFLYEELEDIKKLMYGESGDQKRPVCVEPEDLKRLPYDEPGDLKRSAYDEPGDRKRSAYDEPGDTKRLVYDEVEDRERSLHGESDARKRQMYGGLVDRKRQMYGEPSDTKRQVYDEPIDRKMQIFGEPDDRKRQVYVETDVGQRSLYAELEDRKMLMYCEPRDKKRLVYVEPEDLKRFLNDKPGNVNSKRLKYRELEDKRSVYEELGDRKSALYDEPEDGSGYMFSETNDQNFPVTERNRPVLKVVGQNRPPVEEIERSRLMPGEREREVVLGGCTDINRTCYYAADSKVGSEAEDGDKEASKRHRCHCHHHRGHHHHHHH